MLPVYLGWILYGGPWLVFHDADIAVALASIGYISLLPIMVGNLCYLYGVSAVGPARAAAFLYLSPLFSATFAIGWLGERIAWYHAGGIAAIFAGLYLLGRSAAALAPSVTSREGLSR
jgi:drug/metabolite transporter (DMT)-like permease